MAKLPVWKDGSPLWIDNGSGVLVPAWAEDPCVCCEPSLICADCPNDHYATSYNIAVSGIGGGSACAFMNSSHSAAGSSTAGGGGWITGPISVSGHDLYYYLYIACDDGPSGAGYSLVFGGVYEGPSLASPTTKAEAVWEIVNCTDPTGAFSGTMSGSFGGIFCSGDTPTITVS